jgi:retron-type reverse transcriptase
MWTDRKEGKKGEDIERKERRKGRKKGRKIPKIVCNITTHQSHTLYKHLNINMNLKYHNFRYEGRDKSKYNKM